MNLGQIWEQTKEFLRAKFKKYCIVQVKFRIPIG